MSLIDTKAFFKLSYGLYVISSTSNGRLNGQIANTVFQISSDPPTVGISINRNNLTNEFIKDSKVFSISVLSKETPLDFIGHFGFKSGRDIDKYKDVEYKDGLNGAPILSEHAISSIEAEVMHSYEVETHTVFVGKVLNAEVLNSGEPMTYAYYHQLKRVSVPKTDTDQVKEGDTKYQCSVCGYIYDPAAGVPDKGISPMAFKDLPDDWVCPVCGMPKDKFNPIK